MEYIILLYVFFTGCVFVSWLWDATDTWDNKLLNILFGFVNGWYVTPFLVGRAIKKFYKG